MTISELLQDPEVLRAADPYKVMAAKFFVVPEDRVTKEQRQSVKKITLYYRYYEEMR